MSIERSQPSQPFEFTEREKLYDQISHKRLLTLLVDEQTHIHEAELSENSYGEFLFITVSRPSEKQRTYYTLYGMGYHEYRERWITDLWSWFRSERMPSLEAKRMTQEEVMQIIDTRLAAIRPGLETPTQTPRGLLYEMLAEIADEDGAISELEDLADWFFDDEDDQE